VKTVDAFVIGGGPAGSTCAWQLRRRGLDVAVLDRRSFPRDKVCAGWITPAVVEALELDLDDYGQARTLQPLTGFRIGMMGRPEAITVP
jgi:menaquinone-9 beta-reductase